MSATASAAVGEGPVARPIFVIGTGRSGTTVVFESLSNHPDLGWFNYHFDRMPRLPWLAAAARMCDWGPAFRKAVTVAGERRPWLERFRDGPAEAYHVWESLFGEKFRYDYLLDRSATPDERDRARALVARVVALQKKKRFAAKITGPARMGFLMSVFPDARFVNIVRDGRAVVHSLLQVDYWKGTRREREPAWRGGLRDEYRRAWEERGRKPLVLAAVQWRNLIERAREEKDRYKPDCYLEVRYEDFLDEPHAFMEEICRACGLAQAPEIHRFIDDRLQPERRPERWRTAFSEEEIDILDELMGTLLEDLGYEL